MIKFKKVRFKNFFTFGNSFTEISLDNKERTVLITGKNGAGKCLRENTNIDINFSTEEAREAFEKFLTS